MRELTIEYLKSHSKASTSELLDYLNKRLKHGTTSHALGNVLGKDPRFKEIEKQQREDREKTAKQVVWGLTSAVSPQKG